MSLELELKKMFLEVENTRVSETDLFDLVDDGGGMKIPFCLVGCPFSLN